MSTHQQQIQPGLVALAAKRFPASASVTRKPGAVMIVIMLLVLLLPAFGKVYSVLNAQPLLLNLAAQEPAQNVNVIVQKTTRATDLEETVKNLGGTVTTDLAFINSFVAQLPAGRVPDLASQAGIKWVSLDSAVVKTGCDACMAAGDDANYTSAVNANQVWNDSKGKAPWLQGQGIGVAILDSGVNPNLVDFTDQGGKNSRVVSSVKIEKNSPSVSDGNGHGTLVAGVIGSNGKGSSGKNPGVAPQATLVSVKISNDDGSSAASDVLAGLQWVYTNAKQYNIRVINLSLTSSVAQSYNVDPLDAGVEALWLSGITVVVAAGNNGTANLFAPANDPFVITVGAATNSGTASAPNWVTAPFSAYGTDEAGNSKPDLVAPGTGIISDVATLSSQIATNHKDKLVSGPGAPGGPAAGPAAPTGGPGPAGSGPTNQTTSSYDTSYMKVAGTSFAAPQVAGTVALLLQSNPKLTPDQIKYRLKATALKNVPQGSWDTRSSWAGYDPVTAGAGFLDVQAAVTQSGITGKSNTGLVPSALLLSVLVELKASPVPGNAVNYTSVNWSSVNWSSVNWSSVNWSSVNWSSVNWSSVNWSSVNWSSVNWSSVNWSGIYWGS